jgi:hypothetical protein
MSTIDHLPKDVQCPLRSFITPNISYPGRSHESTKAASIFIMDGRRIGHRRPKSQEMVGQGGASAIAVALEGGPFGRFNNDRRRRA